MSFSARTSHPDTLVESGYAPVNGLQMYYEIHGDGPPLVLLHGGMVSFSACFSTMLPTLAAKHRVIGIEQQGHGHTADIDRPLTFEQMADDTAAALRHIGVAQADVLGYSDGGNVALGLAIRHPDLVRKLITAGTNVTNEGLKPGIIDELSQLTPEMLGDEIRDLYASEAPNPEDWPTLVTKIVQQAVSLVGWQPEQLQSIAAPTLVVIGDDDIIRVEHASEMVSLIPHAHLAVLPRRDHMMLVMRPEPLVPILDEFLTAPMPEAV
jgi:pimeloyl-ACP methyl ester carboxylesterase